MLFRDLKEFDQFIAVTVQGKPLHHKVYVKIPRLQGIGCNRESWYNCYSNDGMCWLFSDVENVRFVKNLATKKEQE